MDSVHWFRFKIGIIYIIIGTIIGILLSLFLIPLYFTATVVSPQITIVIIILMFLIGAYVTGWLIIWISTKYICKR